jgi:hypothetical protein
MILDHFKRGQRSRTTFYADFNGLFYISVQSAGFWPWRALIKGVEIGVGTNQ